MKFGINLLLWTGNMDDSILPTLEMLKTAGFDGVELPIFTMTPEEGAKWGKRLDDLGLQRTAVTIRTEEDSPISADPAIRAKGIAGNKMAVDCCRAMGAQALVGPYYGPLGYFTGAGPTGDEMKWGVESMQAVAEHAAGSDLVLGIEFLNRFEIYLLNTAADAQRFVEAVSDPRCGVLYDTFHANIEEKSPSRAVQDCAASLCHVHIAENDRSTPGQGSVAWTKVFDALAKVGYDGWLTIEAFGMSLPELAAATKIWRRMFDTEEGLAKDGLAFMKSEVAKRW
ncbi:MAG: sugar phosphate isomerase/epimerase family protein [Alphaproteobacteria bacterium]